MVSLFEPMSSQDNRQQLQDFQATADDFSGFISRLFTRNNGFSHRRAHANTLAPHNVLACAMCTRYQQRLCTSLGSVGLVSQCTCTDR